VARAHGLNDDWNCAFSGKSAPPTLA
jgi:hypothetical protein